MRPLLAAVVATLLVSCDLAAQPARGVSRRLMLSRSDWGCTPEQIATLRELAAFAARPRQTLVPWSRDEASLDCRSYMDILHRLGTG